MGEPRTAWERTVIPPRTARLILRQWRPSDLEPFAQLNADPEVMRFFPAPLSREESDALAERIRLRIEEAGVGLFALELRESGEFLGFTGLNPMPEWSPGSGFLEIGWRLRREAWGRGYATEAALECLRFAGEHGVPEVWSLTARLNIPSIAVMRRIGLEYVAALDHPDVDGPLKPHVFYRRGLT
ncbi:GNAT family N-acetyltransferase [Mobilicoccus massiliensis]|uniref:GNAT family N-acetyltransferase n=1 Tax=Mobilicoccus massiliensis TaxID=1522310 RepID=UPI0006931D44|nr:GNAT family N-acetyltransferase [Mobilicoccus massiliensis]